MLRPESWTRPAGVSPVRVSAEAPGSRPRFVVERSRAERGVESLFGGSKRAGRSVKRILQPRKTHNGGAEPLMLRRRPMFDGLAFRTCLLSGPPGVGGVARTHGLVTEQERPVCAALSAKTAWISRW
jgi:hypothetical protein